MRSRASKLTFDERSFDAVGKLRLRSLGYEMEVSGGASEVTVQ